MIDNGYKCHSLIIEVKQNSGGLKICRHQKPRKTGCAEYAEDSR